MDRILVIIFTIYFTVVLLMGIPAIVIVLVMLWDLLVEAIRDFKLSFGRD